MKYFKLYESKLGDAKKELKHFHVALNLDQTIDELMESIEAVKIDLHHIFPSLNGDENLKDLSENEKFKSELEESDLKLGDYYNTEDFETFSRIPFKWYFIYTSDSSELEEPVYILFKYYYDKKWSDMNLYYIQGDGNELLRSLNIITIEFRHKDGNRWFYTTSNSGVDWELDTNTKIIKDKKEVKSSEPTANFTKTLDWDKVLLLAKHPDVDLFIY